MNINYGIGPFTCQQESKERRNGEGTERQRWGGREEEMKKSNTKDNSVTTGLPEIFA